MRTKAGATGGSENRHAHRAGASDRISREFFPETADGASPFGSVIDGAFTANLSSAGALFGSDVAFSFGTRTHPKSTLY